MSCCNATPIVPTFARYAGIVTSLPRSTPESQNVSPSAISDFAAALGKLEHIHSMMVVRHGKVVGEQWWAPGAPEEPHVLWSLSKSFTSTAVGLVITDGLLSLDDKIVDLLPDDLPAEIDAHLAALAVRHLLTMSTGHASESLPDSDRGDDTDWAKHALAQPFEFEPGARFVYNSGATYLLSAIVQRITGQTVLDYLTPRIFEPLGITGATWEQSPQGISIGGWGLSILTEDIAKFGQLYLQQGQWDGAQLVPAAWISQATSRQISNEETSDQPDWMQGYGFQFWQCRFGAFRGDGKDGQFCIVMPEQDAVVVLTAKLTDMTAELNLVWTHILPGLQ
jgi:CubicO group peptidase (beta-lactamase class C family)